MTGWTPNPAYWTGTQPRERHRVTTSVTEVSHLAIAYSVLVLDILLIEGFIQFRNGPGTLNVPLFEAGLAFSLTAAFTGFIAHEMAHKIVAQRLGFWAEFRAAPYGLLMAVVTSVLGFILAAPGATVVGGVSANDRRGWGRTSLAGPLTNVAFAAIFYGASIVAYLLGSVLFVWLLLLAFINAWFGTFNLFPFGVLDGRKVFLWNRGIWAGAIALTLTVMAVAALALYIFGTPLLSL